MSVPNSQKNIEALNKLDFIMSFDVYLSETAKMADLVIRGTHFLERYDLTANWVNFPSVSLRQPVVKTIHGGPQAMMDKGLDPLPHIENRYGKDHEEYPLALINWKCVEHTHTRTQNNPWLMEMAGDNPLWMNPITAEKLGLNDNDLVRIQSATGEGYVRCVWD